MPQTFSKVKDDIEVINQFLLFRCSVTSRPGVIFGPGSVACEIMYKIDRRGREGGQKIIY